MVCHKLKNGCQVSGTSSGSPKTAIEMSLLPYFPTAKIAIRSGNMALVVEKCAIRLYNNFEELVETLDTIRFGSELIVQTMEPHHLVAHAASPGGYILVDVKASFREYRICSVRVEETFTKLTAAHLNVLTVAETPLESLKGPFTRTCTLRVFSDTMTLVAKHSYCLDQYFHDESPHYQTIEEPVGNIRLARQAKLARRPGPRNPVKIRAEPLYSLQIMKDQVLVMKFNPQTRLNFSLLNFKRDNTWTKICDLDITDDLKIQPRDTFDFSTLCKFQPKPNLTSGILVLLHPERMLEYSVVRVLRGSLTQVVSFESCRRTPRPLIKQLSPFLPVQGPAVHRSYKQLWDPSSQQGKDQRAKMKEAMKDDSGHLRTRTSRIRYLEDQIKPIFAVTNTPTKSVVGQSLFVDPISGELFLRADFSKGEAFYRKTQNRATKFYDLMEAVYTVTSRIKLS